MSTQKILLELPTDVLQKIETISKENHRQRKAQCEFILSEFAKNPFTLTCANETELQQLTRHLSLLRMDVKN